MKTKKIPVRTCVVSHEKLPKKELVRVVRMPDGKVEIDETGKLNGCGAYLKRDKSIIEKAIKSKVLEKHLKVEVEDEVYDKLLKIC